MNEFRRTGLGKLVDGRLDVRCANYGYQYCDIMLALFCVYLCGGDHIEDITAMLKNFYQYLLAKVNEIFPGVDMKSRLKRFVFAFIVVPAKWVRVATQWILNIYTKDRWLHYRTPYSMSVTDEPNVLEGLSFVNSDGGKGVLCSHISQHMVKSQSEQEKSHSLRWGHNALRLLVGMRIWVYHIKRNSHNTFHENVIV